MLGSSCGTCWWGVGRRPTDRDSSSCLPANPCAHLTVRLPHGTQRPLSAAVSHSPTSQTWVCWIHTGWTWARAHTGPLPSPEDKRPGVGCNLEPTMDTKSPSTLRELEAVGAPTFSQRSSSTKSAAFRELHSERTLCPPPWLSPVGCVRGLQSAPPLSRRPLTWPSGSPTRVHSLQFRTSRTCKDCRGKRGPPGFTWEGDFLTGGWKEVVEAYELK